MTGIAEGFRQGRKALALSPRSAEAGRAGRIVPGAGDDQGTIWRIIASSLVKSIGLVMCAVNPASRLRTISSSMP
jgi:hypothetical protein